MYHDICKEAPKCIRGARNVMIFTIMLALGLSISYYSDLTPLGVDNEFLSTLYAQTAGSAIGVCILFIPTYFYLKKRFYSPGSVSEVMIKPEKAIPIRLLGVIDQKQRDPIIAEYMSETINPYTGHSIDNQSEWTIYQNGLPTKHPQTPAETAPETGSTTELIPKIGWCSNIRTNLKQLNHMPHPFLSFLRRITWFRWPVLRTLWSSHFIATLS